MKAIVSMIVRRVLGASLALNLVASPAQALDLVQAYEAAKTEDAQLNAARAALDSGLETGAQGRASLYPNLNLSAGISKGASDLSPNNGLSSSSTSNNKTITLSLTQPLFRWQNWQTFEQGKTSALLAEAQFAQAEQDLILRVAQAYFNVLSAYDSLQTLRTQEVAVKQQLESTQRNFAIGSATILDTQQAQASLDQVAAQIIAAQANVEIKQAQLRVLTNRDETNYAQLTSQFELPLPSESIKDWMARARENNSSVVLQRYNELLAEQALSKTRGNDYPTLDLVGSIARNDGTSTSTGASALNGVSTTKTIGLQLNVPISAWVVNRSATRQGAAALRQAQYNLILAQRNAELTARQAYLGVINGKNQIKALEAALVSSQSLLASTKRGYEVGVRINLDVLNAQQQLAQTQLNLAAARYAALLASLQLKYATGNLSVSDIQQLNQFLK